MALGLTTIRARSMRVAKVDALGRPVYEPASLVSADEPMCVRFSPESVDRGEVAARGAMSSSNSDGDEQAPLTTTRTTRATNSARRA